MTQLEHHNVRVEIRVEIRNHMDDQIITDFTATNTPVMTSGTTADLENCVYASIDQAQLLISEYTVAFCENRRRNGVV